MFVFFKIFKILIDDLLVMFLIGYVKDVWFFLLFKKYIKFFDFDFDE